MRGRWVKMKIRATEWRKEPRGGADREDVVPRTGVLIGLGLAVVTLGDPTMVAVVS